MNQIHELARHTRREEKRICPPGLERYVYFVHSLLLDLKVLAVSIYKQPKITSQ